MNSNSVLTQANSALETLVMQSREAALDIVDEGTLSGLLYYKGLVVISQERLRQLLEQAISPSQAA